MPYIPVLNKNYCRAASLAAFLYHRHASHTIDQVQAAAEVIEPPRTDHPMRVDAMIGQTGFIASYPMRAMLNPWQVAGWTQELWDHDEVVIALRRQVGRRG